MGPGSIGDGFAKLFVVPASMKQLSSQIAKESRCVVTKGPEQEWSWLLQPIEDRTG